MRVRNWSQLPLVLSARETAEVMGVTENTALIWLKKGHIPGRKVGRTWCVSRDELRALLTGTAPD